MEHIYHVLMCIYLIPSVCPILAMVKQCKYKQGTVIFLLAFLHISDWIETYSQHVVMHKHYLTLSGCNHSECEMQCLST